MTPTAPRIIVAALASAASFLSLGAATALADVSIVRSGNQLEIRADDAPNRIDIDTSPAGTIRVDVNDDAVFEHIGSSTVTNTVAIEVLARGGDDNITFDETNNALPTAVLNGDSGNDILQGTSSGDLVTGGSGDDRIDTRGGADVIAGNQDADTITPGPGGDEAQGDDGDDTFVWNDGDGSDETAGEAGSDVQVVNGKRGSENVTLARKSATGVTFARTVIDEFEIDADTIERIRFNGNEGSDDFVAANNLSGVLEAVEVNMGSARFLPNTVDGSDVTDIVTIGDGPTEIDTQEGDDEFRWSLAARRLGSAELDMGGGNDKVSVEGSDGADEIEVADDTGKLQVSHSANDASLEASGVDQLTVDAAEGDDSFTPTPNVTNLVTLDVSGGGGSDRLFGGADAETLRGGKGDDTVVANGGDDTLRGDAGTDTLVGGAGADSFFCGGVGDTFEATPEDTVAADCLANPEPPVEEPPAGDPPAGNDPPAGTEPIGLPAGFKGFARPVVTARGSGNLKVNVRNTHRDAITLRIAARERGSRYRAVTRTIRPVATAGITLRVPAKLRAALRRKLEAKGRLVRRPRVTVTHVATGGKTTVRPRIRLKARAR
jgi:Ca2+-binding RTX toxin-like protein